MMGEGKRPSIMHINKANCGKYEPDSSPEAWEFYKNVYFPVFEKKCWDTLNENGKRICIKDQSGVEFAGDVIFNFKYSFYKSQLKDDQDNLKRLILFNQDEYHYAYCNLSIMPKTGKLQGIKGIMYKDRIDQFLYELRSYYYAESHDEHPFITLYRGDGQGHVKPRLKEMLMVFLDSMGKGEYGFVNYCEKIYNIGGTLANKLAENGIEELDTADRVIKYMDLAEEFWNERILNLKTIYATGE